MRILFISKGSTKTGLGHVIRSTTLATEAFHKNHEVESIIIGEAVVTVFTRNAPFSCKLIDNESQITQYLDGNYDVIILDLLDLAIKWVERLKTHTKLLVSISPIFNHMNQVDLLFNRTSYIPESYKDLPTTKYLGLQYSIIQKNCLKIPTEDFQKNLSRDVLSIALCMGGGDAGNKTLRYLQYLTKCPTPATFWVLLGEGYRHSYDQLVNAIEHEKEHEVVLAKTNKSMWHILKNCAAIILPGGITTYEAIYSGLPTINTYEKEEQYFLIGELVEQGVSINAGISSDQNLSNICSIIEDINQDRDKLMAMHKKATRLIDGLGSVRILDLIESHLADLN